MNVRVCSACGEEYTRARTEAAATFLRRRYCSLLCFGSVTRGRPIATKPLVPRERVAAILRAELDRYDGTILIPGPRNSRVPDARLSNMVTHIARTTGRSLLSVDRRVRMILTGTGNVSSRTGIRGNEGVEPRTVDWLLDGLERPDVWYVELADWARLLAAYAAKQLTLDEYQEQSRLYNAQAETAAVSTGSKATVSDQRRVAA